MTIRYHIFTLIWGLLVTLMILMPGGGLPSLEFFDLMGFDKMVHFFAFAILAFLMLIGLSKQFSEGCFYFNIYYMTVFSLIGYGVVLEFVQGYIPGRSFDWWDSLANILGVIFGRFLFYMIYKTRLI